MAQAPTVLGVKETLKTLRKVEPEVYKELMKETKRAGKPMADAAMDLIPDGPPLSGMARGRLAWSSKSGRVTINFGGRKTKGAFSGGSNWPILRMMLKDGGGMQFDMAASGTFGENLTNRFGKASRSMWRAAEQHLPKVQDACEDAIRTASRKINRELVTYGPGGLI